MYLRVHSLAASFCFAKTSLLHGTTAIRGGSEQPFRKPFEIDGVDPRREKKLTGGVSLIR